MTPMESINLHFTGDIHAIGAANNLLAAMLETHLLHGNGLGIDPLSITWKRCVDMNDRALRRVVIGLGGRVNGSPRETGFDITAASEVMAVVAMSTSSGRSARAPRRNHRGNDVRGRAGDGRGAPCRRIDGRPARRDDQAESRPDARGPARDHALRAVRQHRAREWLGLADQLGLKLGDYVVTESGFGSDMGFEKLVDIVCRSAGLVSSVAVVVATTQALKHHGGDPEAGSTQSNAARGISAAHMGLVRRFGLECVVAVNRFPGDDPGEIEAVRGLALELGAAAEINDGFEQGGGGAAALAEAVVAAAAAPSQVEFLYSLEDTIEEKIAAIATQAYGAAGVELAPAAPTTADRLTAAGLGGLPVCMAKTHLSLSHDPTLVGAPPGSRSRSASFGPIPEPAGSSRSAVRCRRCPDCRLLLQRSGSTSIQRGRSPACAEEPLLARLRHGLELRMGVEVDEHAVHVVAGRRLGHAEAGCDRADREARGEQVQHLQPARRRRGRPYGGLLLPLRCWLQEVDDEIVRGDGGRNHASASRSCPDRERLRLERPSPEREPCAGTTPMADERAVVASPAQNFPARPPEGLSRGMPVRACAAAFHSTISRSPSNAQSAEPERRRRATTRVSMAGSRAPSAGARTALQGKVRKFSR